MNQYQALDELIIRTIAEGRSPLYSARCNTEAGRIANATGRETFRVIDGRLQALRTRGRIRYVTKSEGKGVSGWQVLSSADEKRA